MKEKILNALKTTYANLGLSEKALVGVASFLEKTVTDEGQIDAAVKEASVEGLLKIYQSEMDSERQKAAASKKALEDYKKNNPSKQDVDDPKNDVKDDSETAEVLKALKDEIAALKNRNAVLDKANSDAAILKSVREAIKSEHKDDSRTDNLLNLILRNATVSEGDTAESLTERYKAEYTEQYKALYGDGAQGGYGNGGTSFADEKDPWKNVAENLKRRGYVPAESN